MQYIDAAMVGRLGAADSAAIGLVSTTLWLFWGTCSAAMAGFSVQTAHRIGAGDYAAARRVLRQGIIAALAFGGMMAFIGMAIASPLPRWLGGAEHICMRASVYFFIFVAALPLLTMNYFGSAMLRASGNMKVPGGLNVLMCQLDVVFNFFLIYPSRELMVGGNLVIVPGAGLGVFGAALGTVCAEIVCASAMMYYLCRRQAVKIAVPMTAEHIIFCGAQITITLIVAPLGVVAIAANAFAVTAESLCYMPGFGIGEAATTLCGQSYGAGRYPLVRRFCYLTTMLGMAIMTVMAVVMYVCAPMMMEIMTPVAAIAEAGTEVLRIEAFAEPMYAASIVAYGAFVGVGDTLIPAIMNFGSGLQGVWIAMAAELTFRGIIFLIRMRGKAWLKPGRTAAQPDAVPEV